MALVVNTIEIDGSLEAVFDLATTTRFWPQWHPATVGVGGVTERPMQLGDKVRERAVIGGKTLEGNWTVVEHSRPVRVVLLMEGGRINISYAFETVKAATEFKRTMEFYPEDFGGSAGLVEKLMYSQSEQALVKLKALIEAILQQEARLEIGD